MFSYFSVCETELFDQPGSIAKIPFRASVILQTNQLFSAVMMTLEIELSHRCQCVPANYAHKGLSCKSNRMSIYLGKSKISSSAFLDSRHEAQFYKRGPGTLLAYNYLTCDSNPWASICCCTVSSLHSSGAVFMKHLRVESQ